MRIRGRRFAMKKFAVNKAEGKALGVCAGIADMTGIDATIIRIAVVLATLMAFPWVPIAYLAAALLAREGGGSRYTLADHQADADRLRAQDLRMQAIETYVTSSNSQLAREIEELR